MKLNANGGVVLFLVLALSACGAGDVEPEPGSLTGNAATMASQLPLEDCAEFGCPNGCVQIDYGVDDNANGALDNPSEIDGTEYVCHGTNGADGEDGAQGDAGSDGENGTNGTNGTNGDAGADGDDCTVSAVDCLATLTCADGTSVSWNLMGCMPEGMVEVSGGDFLYGDPATSIYLSTFYIDQYEVSAGDYKSCVDAGVCQYNGSTTDTYRTYDNGKDDHPINYVDWNEATAYCAWKGKHLPTEQEWEKAARGTDGRTYPWGEDAPDGTRSNYYESGDAYEDASENGTTPVGYYNGVNTLAGGTTSTVNSPGPYGAYDMAGNVFEWTNSWYSSAMSYRVLRGGSFSHVTGYLRSSVRGYDSPGYRYFSFGFRCAQ